jgi:uncharacterized phage protein (TIGR01671 family)
MAETAIRLRFRAKSLENGAWLHSSVHEVGFWISMNDGLADRSTIGEFSGLHDKNGAEIYEGDVVYRLYKDENRDWYRDTIGAFVWNDWMSGFAFRTGGASESVQGASGRSWEVVGNIYDNPELLEQNVIHKPIELKSRTEFSSEDDWLKQFPRLREEYRNLQDRLYWIQKRLFFLEYGREDHEALEQHRTPRPWNWGYHTTFGLKKTGKAYVFSPRYIFYRANINYNLNPSDAALIVEAVNGWDNVKALQKRIDELEARSQTAKGGE